MHLLPKLQQLSVHGWALPVYLYPAAACLALACGYLAAVALAFSILFAVGLFQDRQWVLRPGLKQLVRYALAPLYGFRCADATTVGYTTIIYGTDSMQLRAHEAYHRFQSEREIPEWAPRLLGRLIGALVYGVNYLVEYVRHGYNDNIFEQEARKAAGQE